VLSPSSARADRFTKRAIVSERDVPLYWVIDPDGRFVEIWRPDDDFPRVERRALSWSPAGATEPFSLELADSVRSGRGAVG